MATGFRLVKSEFCQVDYIIKNIIENECFKAEVAAHYSVWRAPHY